MCRFPIVRDLRACSKKVIISAMGDDMAFRTRDARLSAQLALFGLRFFRSFSTPLSFTTVSGEGSQWDLSRPGSMPVW